MKIFNKTIHIAGDKEGFIILECPYCGSEFKLSSEDLRQEENIYPEIFCPYCGLLKNIKYFFTTEIKSKASRVKILKDINSNSQNNQNTDKNLTEIKLYPTKDLDLNLDNIMKNSSKDNNLYKMDLENRELKKVNIERLKGKELKESLFKCKICDCHEKILTDGKTILFCSYCGVDL